MMVRVVTWSDIRAGKKCSKSECILATANRIYQWIKCKLERLNENIKRLNEKEMSRKHPLAKIPKCGLGACIPSVLAIGPGKGWGWKRNRGQGGFQGHWYVLLIIYAKTQNKNKT